MTRIFHPLLPLNSSLKRSSNASSLDAANINMYIAQQEYGADLSLGGKKRENCVRGNQNEDRAYQVGWDIG